VYLFNSLPTEELAYFPAMVIFMEICAGAGDQLCFLCTWQQIGPSAGTQIFVFFLPEHVHRKGKGKANKIKQSKRKETLKTKKNKKKRERTSESGPNRLRKIRRSSRRLGCGPET